GRRIVQAADEPELFWALRGGGGEFGVGTEFEFQAVRVGTVLGGLLVYPWERAREAFAAARSVMVDAPDELTTFVVLITAPPELGGGRAAVIAVAWSGDVAEGERVIAPLRAGATHDFVAPMPYVALQSMLDHTAPAGWRYHDQLHYLREVGDGFVDALIDGFEDAPTAESHVMTAWMGGAIDRVAAGETAFGHRGARALTWLIGCSGEEEIEPAAGWVRRLFEATAPFATGGVYVNALDAGRPARDGYAPAVWERLLAVKRRYDPDGGFDAHGLQTPSRSA